MINNHSLYSRTNSKFISQKSETILHCIEYCPNLQRRIFTWIQSDWICIQPGQACILSRTTEQTCEQLRVRYKQNDTRCFQQNIKRNGCCLYKKEYAYLKRFKSLTLNSIIARVRWFATSLSWSITLICFSTAFFVHNHVLNFVFLFFMLLLLLL